MTPDIALRPAHQLAVAIRCREVSSRELLDHYLARVERLNPPLNAVVTLDPDGARRAADAADAALTRGELGGPLHGVPMTIKDTYETAGMRTTCGVAAWDHVPERDADAVQRLRAAGAVIFGKTNPPALAGDWQTFNPIFGTTNNPWDITRTTGGSSGGSAAAVATGMTALELGSDIGGSIRVPSHWCGVCGHKPSWGIISQRGHLPPFVVEIGSDLYLLLLAIEADQLADAVAEPMPVRLRQEVDLVHTEVDRSGGHLVQ